MNTQLSSQRASAGGGPSVNPTTASIIGNLARKWRII